MKNIAVLIALITSLFITSYGQSPQFNWAGKFETGATFAANNWTVVNTAQTNQWWCGTAVAGQIGVRCAYVGTAAANNNYNYY